MTNDPCLKGRWALWLLSKLFKMKQYDFEKNDFSESTSFNNHWIIQGQVTVTVRSNSCQMIHLDSTMGNQPGMISTFDHGTSFFPARLDAPGTRHCWCPNSRLRSEQLLDGDLFVDFWGTHEVGQGWNCWWFLGFSDLPMEHPLWLGNLLLGRCCFSFFWGFLGWVVAEYLKGNLLKDTNFWSGNDRILAMKW